VLATIWSAPLAFRYAATTTDRITKGEIRIKALSVEKKLSIACEGDMKPRVIIIAKEIPTGKPSNDCCRNLPPCSGYRMGNE
jgi:hypothetical protein